MKDMKNILLIFVGALFMLSCEDFLDKNPDNRTVLDSPEAVSELLVSAYPEAIYHGFTEVMSDNVDDKGIGRYVAEFIPNENAYYWNDHGADTYDSPTFYWNSCYAAIAAANHALDAIEEASFKDKYSAQRGEALAARAYAHFMLVNLFANNYNPQTSGTDLGIPYVIEPETVVFKNYKRATVQKIYDDIEKDLNEIFESNLIKDENYTVPKYHFTKSAVHALASRFYLFKGNWDKVIEHSNYVLAADAAGKLRDWNGKYLEYGANDLWAQYTKAEESANILLSRSYTNWGSGFIVFRYSLSPKKIAELFGQSIAGESRFDLVIGDKILYAAGDQQLGFVPKYKPRTETHDGNTDIGYPNTIVPLFTMEEVLFNRAEAYAMKEHYNLALADIDTYISKRKRGYDPEKPLTEEDMEKAYENVSGPELAPFYEVKEAQKLYLWYLLDLRRREFVHEGMRWFDIKRFNFEITHDLIDGGSMTLAKDDLRRAIQIPSTAVASGITPNPR